MEQLLQQKIEEMDIMSCCMTWTKNILQAYSGENSTFFSKKSFFKDLSTYL